ncbi:hypothetical protein E4U34_000318 [Claviceps purpurea]|nr:hypothetical protein E4U34_000318 [Claviceps purpurea]
MSCVMSRASRNETKANVLGIASGSDAVYPTHDGLGRGKVKRETAETETDYRDKRRGNPEAATP